MPPHFRHRKTNTPLSLHFKLANLKRLFGKFTMVHYWQNSKDIVLNKRLIDSVVHSFSDAAVWATYQFLTAQSYTLQSKLLCSLFLKARTV